MKFFSAPRWLAAPWWIVFVKEVRENLRDRRAILSSLVVGAVLGPLLFAGMINFIIQQQADKAQKDLDVPVIGAEHAPSLVDWLRRQGVNVTPPPDDALAAVRAREVELVVEIPAAYAGQWNDGQPAVVRLVVDSSRRDSDTSVTRVQSLLQAWGQQVGSMRLLARGVDPAVVRALQVQTRDVSTPESRGALILAMWPYLLMISVFVGGMYLAIDATAGERERQSMEPLLLNPVSAAQVVSGKMLATVSFALLALFLALVMFRVGVNYLPVEDLGIRLNMGAGVLVRVFLLMLPVALLAAGLQTLVAAFSKGYREAQTYISLLMFIPLLPSLWLALSPVKPALWMMWVPLLNQSMLIQMLSRDEAIPAGWHAVAWLTTAAAGVVVAGLARHFYQRPAIIGN